MERIALNLTVDFFPASVPELKIQRQAEKPSRLAAFPVRAHVLRDAISTSMGNGVMDEFHATSQWGFDYIGIFALRSREFDDFQWAVACTVNGPGNTVKMYSGIYLPNFRHTISMHAISPLINEGGPYTDAEIASLVNEKMKDLHFHYVLELERMEVYKKFILTRAMAHDLICVMVERDVIAGRVMPEFLEVWHKKTHTYTTPRTGWSLFCEISWLLNRLKAVAMFERTMVAHDFFDEAFNFSKKALKTVWRQQTFA